MRFRPYVAKLGVVTAASAMLLAAESCKEPTSVEIEVRTTLQPNEVRGTQFFVGGDPSALESDVGNGYPSAETANAGADGFVGTLVSIPPDGESGSLSIVVVLGFSNAPSACRPQNGYKGCIVARRRLAYRKNERLRVPILLDPSCVDVPCDAVSTCAKGSCFSSSIECAADGSCRGPENGGTQRPPERPIDGGAEAAVDASDASADAPPDALVDSPIDAPADRKFDGPIEPSSPDAIRCPGQPDCALANETCCISSGSGTCLSDLALCAPPTLTVRCDGPEDCGIRACCIVTNGTACLPACPTEESLCHSDADCPLVRPTCTPLQYANFYRVCR
ncbi:MAG: hypothetical protein JST00_45765 [Deltaproteobacteria bacterium]|nr:hypothetical protein [Deltaproteobacteria bacterium]